MNKIVIIGSPAAGKTTFARKLGSKLHMKVVHPDRKFWLPGWKEKHRDTRIDILIYSSQGKIPEVFLKEAGVPDSFIDYMRSLVGSPIDYYSCFISYSSKDQAFAERLYADLHSKGVRCWFAPHDMRIGDEIRPRIDESIRIHDKLLLVLSESSLASTWVKKEVETAFEKEAQQNTLVLFPVRLDDTMMHTPQVWAADIRRMRHIGDFTRWENQDEYQKAFDRLLRDLKAEVQKPGN
jgi:GTPase SAR1 family protein